MKFLLGLKIGMSQIFDEKGDVIPVTLIKAGPCVITQVKTKEKDGFSAIQIGFGEAKKINKAISGHLKSLGEMFFLKEFKIAEASSNSKINKEKEIKIKDKELKRGDNIDASIFKEGDLVKISGLSKGKGFAGAVKRWNFAGRPATHGTKHELKTLGSVGIGGVGRVTKGKKMPGRMGFERITVRNLKIARIDLEKNLIAVRGAVPGTRGTLLEIRG